MRNWFITAFLFVSYISFSQSNFLLNKFEVENISSENVKSIFLDKNNFFWISTSDGINRYDGSLNSIYKSNPFDSTTLSNNSVLETFQISDDGLFIKSTSGLDYFSYSKNTFQRIDIDAPISQTKYDNSLIITSKNDGVFILNLEDFSTKNLKFDPRNPLSISSSNFNNNQNQVTLPVNDDIWIGTSYGLNKYNIKTDLNKRFYETNANNTLNSNIINDLFYVEEDLSGSKISISNKILASTQNGLSLINPENDEIYNYPSLINSNIYNIFTLDSDILIHNEDGIFLIKNIDEQKINLEKISNSSALSKVRKISNNEFILYSSSSNLFKRIIKSKKNYLDLDVDVPEEFKINDIRNYKGAYYIATENGIYKVTEKLNSLSKKNEDLLSNEKIISEIPKTEMENYCDLIRKHSLVFDDNQVDKNSIILCSNLDNYQHFLGSKKEKASRISIISNEKNIIGRIERYSNNGRFTESEISSDPRIILGRFFSLLEGLKTIDKMVISWISSTIFSSKNSEVWYDNSLPHAKIAAVILGFPDEHIISISERL